MGMKPIFEEERQFFKEKTNIDLPKECWRSGTKIYLDLTCNKPLYTFKVDMGKIKITKNNTKLFSSYKQLTLNELIKQNEDKIYKLYRDSVDNLYNYIINNPNYLYIVSYSGGKDSDVTLYVWYKALEELQELNKDVYNNLDWCLNSANTSNDTADTFKQMKRIGHESCVNTNEIVVNTEKYNKLTIGKLNILNPKIGWSKWLVEVKNYFIPTTMVRNCCSTYKEGQITKAYDKNKDTVNVIGVRWQESAKRKDYVQVMDAKWREEHFNANTLPNKWINYAPIIDWSDEDVWLFILQEKINYNRMYNLGFNRIGCLICPFQSDYIDLLIEKYYPERWNWWLGILEKNYEVTHVYDRLKWSLDEWKHGKWKQSTSKEYEIINRKPTNERINELAELKGISYDMASKYFNRTCSCGKKLNPTELSMFYKIYGRYENKQDNRIPLCKKCLCNEQNITAKEYESKVIEFRDQGCKLF